MRPITESFLNWINLDNWAEFDWHECMDEVMEMEAC